MYPVDNDTSGSYNHRAMHIRTTKYLNKKFTVTAVNAALEAGKIIFGASKKPIRYSLKNRLDIQAAADFAAEHSIIKTIKQAFSDHDIFAEESGEDQSNNSDYLWVIDPLDGTINFSRGIEEYCIAIALVHKKKIVLSVIYQPATKKMYVAEVGKGAYLNGKRIRVSKEKNLINMLAATDNSSDPVQRSKNLFCLEALSSHVRHVRIMGSAALHLARVAEGSLDIYFRTKFNYWDVAAGILLIQEAGGRVTDFYGKPFTRAAEGMIASNGPAHARVVKIFKQ